MSALRAPSADTYSPARPAQGSRTAAKTRLDPSGGCTPTTLSLSPNGIDSQRAAALTHLHEVRLTHGGRVPNAAMEEVAEYLELGVPHLRRLLREFEQGGQIRSKSDCSQRKITLPDEWKAKTLYFVHKGCAAKTFEALGKAKALPDRMDLRTFQRRVGEWDPAIRACAKGGYRAMVQHQFFNREHIPYRGYAYGTDHTFLPIQVIPARGSKPVWPWLTTLIDLKTRVVLAYLLTLNTPNTEDSLNTLLEGVHGWMTAEGVFVGGKPEFLRSDRGGDYISDALAKNLINLDVARQFTEPYSSWQNGRVEALNGTLDSEFAPTVPGFHPGGEAEYTRRVLKTPMPATSMITFEALDRRLGDFFAEYNNRVHSALNGMSPLEAWAADEHPVPLADRGTLLYAMSKRDTRGLQHYGIEIRGAHYSHPTLAKLRKQNVKTVEVRYHEHDRNHIEVFVDDKHECTATKTTVQPEHHRLGVLSVRAKQRREAEALIRAADYERVMDERERLREEGVDENDWPTLPAHPSRPEGLDEETEDVITNTLGLGLSQADTSAWLNRMNTHEDLITSTQEGVA